MTDNDGREGCPNRFPLHNDNRQSVVVAEQRDFKQLLGAYTALRSNFNSIQAKHKSALKTIRRLKSDLKSCKLRLAGKDYRPKSAGRNDDAQKDLLLLRLADAEKQLKLLRDNKPLSDASSDKENAYQKSSAQDIEIVELRRKLDEKTIELKKTEELRQINERILRLFHDYKMKHNDIKISLESTTRTLQFKEAENDELKSIIADSRDELTFLQGQIAKLCEMSPRITCEEKQMLLDTIRQKQAELDELQSEYNGLRDKHEELQRSCRFDSGASRHELNHSQDIKGLEQKIGSLEDELDRTKRLLALQVTINDAITKENKELEKVQNDAINECKDKIEDLTLTSSQRLQRIKLLEGLLEAREPSSSGAGKPSGADDYVLEVQVSNASFNQCASLSDKIRSFVLLDFHTFGSMLSPIVVGLEPTYDVTALYNLNVMDQFLLQSLVNGIRVEVYVLENDEVALFASATISCLEGEDAPSVIGSHRLNLCKANGDSLLAGTLNVKVGMKQPLGLVKLIDDSVKGAACTPNGPRANAPMINNAIKVTIDRLAIDTASKSNRCQHFFVQYDFLCFGSEMTHVQQQNDDGEVVFQHESNFAIPVTHVHWNQIMSKISKHCVRFVIFSGSADPDESEFKVFGEAHVDLSELFEKRDLLVQVISLQATTIGNLHICGETIL